jgi:hypothetical protein
MMAADFVGRHMPLVADPKRMEISKTVEDDSGKIERQVVGVSKSSRVAFVAVVRSRIVKKSKPSQNRGLSGGRVASGAVLRYPP